MNIYRPFEERVVDTQYPDRIRQILETGTFVKDTPQGVGAFTCFGELPPMVFNVENGFPLITQRKAPWKSGVGEILAFINGARAIETIQEFGCHFWDSYSGRGRGFGLEPNDLGPASYGGAFHDFPLPNGETFNQISHVIEQIREYPYARTHLVSPWIPFWIGRGGFQKAIVSPCHGWMHFRVFGEKMSLLMHQRSADFPIGVPSNTVQYFALLLAVAHITGLKPWKFIHSFADAHIYENQVESMKELLTREPRRFPTLVFDTNVTDIFSVRTEHFTLTDYDPHPSMEIPYSP